MNKQKMNTFEIVRLIREAPKELLSATQRGLLVMMAHAGDRDGNNINPGVKWLAEYTNVTTRSVIKSISYLVSKNVLIILPNRSRGSHEKSCYEINVDLLQNIRSYRNHLNKINPHKLESSEKVKNKEVVSSESSERRSPESSERRSLDIDENASQVVNVVHLPSERGSPDSSERRSPLTNTPIIKTIDNLIYVEQKLDAVLSAVEKKSKKSSKQTNSWTPQVLEVFKHWQEVLNHKNARLDDDRRKHIVNALKMGFSVEELKKCIGGVKNSAHNMGSNDRGKKYDGLHVIFKNAAQVERFIRNFDIPEAAINKNVTTARNLSFTERNKKRVSMFSDLEQTLFPEFANRPQLIGNKECLLTFNKECETNER